MNLHDWLFSSISGHFPCIFSRKELFFVHRIFDADEKSIARFKIRDNFASCKSMPRASSHELAHRTWGWMANVAVWVRGMIQSAAAAFDFRRSSHRITSFTPCTLAVTSSRVSTPYCRNSTNKIRSCVKRASSNPYPKFQRHVSNPVPCWAELGNGPSGPLQIFSNHDPRAGSAQNPSGASSGAVSDPKETRSGPVLLNSRAHQHVGQGPRHQQTRRTLQCPHSK